MDLSGELEIAARWGKAAVVHRLLQEGICHINAEDRVMTFHPVDHLYKILRNSCLTKYFSNAITLTNYIYTYNHDCH